ncbi:restriction endonuclease subunit S [Geitlerinema splendidum]|nr:restriction endonuclease subunit S [Geitlerinema splendidum]
MISRHIDCPANVPETGWDKVPFGSHVTIRNEKVLPSTFDSETELVELEHIGQGTGRLLGFTINKSNSPKYLFKKGDVLFGRLRAYLRKFWMADCEGLCSTEIWPLVPADECIIPSFIHILVQQRSFTDAASISYGTHMPRSDWEVLAKHEILLPPVDEQRAISDLLSGVDAIMAALERLIDKKRDIKQAVMQQLLTGKTRLPGFSGDWNEKSFGELFDFFGGLSASRDQLNDAEGFCYLHYGDIHSRAQTWIDVSQERTSIPKLDIKLKKVTPTALLRDGDVVFVDASEDAEGTNKHVVIQNPDNVPFVSGLHTIIARQKEQRFSAEWLSYCFNTEFIKRQFRLLAVGTKVKGVNKTTIKQIVLRYPGEEEQQAIGVILRDFDAEVASLELRLSKTRDIKQGMMQQLLTGKVRLI